MRGLIKLITSALIFVVMLVVTLSFINSSKTPAPFGKDYAVLRIFDEDGFNSSEISTIRFAADNASEAVEGALRLWCDAYSRFEDTVSVTNDNGKSSNSACTVTGGDWFMFHNLEFVDGWYYSESDQNFDRVVIDERLSFALFGSNHSEGMRVYIAGVPCYVAGVVALNESDSYTLQFEETPMLYMPENIAEKIFGMKDFDYYEICMQNPVDSHAKNTLASVTEGMNVIDVSSRFGIKNTFENLKTFTSRSIRFDEESFPFWENDDRQREDILVITEVLLLLSFLNFVIQLIIFIYKVRRKQ